MERPIDNLNVLQFLSFYIYNCNNFIMKLINLSIYLYCYIYLYISMLYIYLYCFKTCKTQIGRQTGNYYHTSIMNACTEVKYTLYSHNYIKYIVTIIVSPRYLFYQLKDMWGLSIYNLLYHVKALRIFLPCDNILRL